ncbi:MAG: hypothetical protein WD066_09695 [Planctomycetaceae bacterium]
MDGSILIPCPRCGRDLRLRDRTLLGRTGRCPQCGERFVLEEPDEVELELADAPARSAQSAPAGTSARLVPDEPAAEGLPFDPSAFEASPSAAKAPRGRRAAATNRSAGRGNGESIASASVGDSTAARLREMRRRAKRRRNIGIVIGAVSALLVMGVVIAIRYSNAGSSSAESQRRARTDLTWQQSKDALRANLALADTRNPTRGEPIRLLYIPSGASIVFNLHPREMWHGTQAQNFPHPPPAVLAGLGHEFDEWAKRTIQEICLFETHEIDEALICAHIGPTGSLPFYSAVVRLAEPQKRSELILKFQSELTDEFGSPMYVGPDRAYMLRDNDRTIAIAPAAYAKEMAEAVARPNPTNSSIVSLLHRTDRKRQFTVVCRRQDLIVHRDALFPEELRPIARRFLEWLGNDVDTFAWSAHQGTREFHSELMVRPVAAASPARLYDELRKKLDRASLDILWAVERMRPEVAGAQRLIGRYPAMIEAYSLETLGGIGDDFVRFTTVLPDRAGPNLAIGTTLAWHQSLTTDFDREVAPAQPAGPKLPDTVAGRLRLPVEIAFERTPLQQAFDFIGGEIQVPFDIDGDALMAAGMTKNMPQEQKLGTVPAIQGVQAIIDRYKAEGMCIVIDEAAKTAIVTTITAAMAKNQQPTLTPQ